MYKFSIGSDPEFMIRNKQGRYLSAIEIIKHNKYNRLKIGDHEYYYDNVMAETAVKPGKTKEEFINNFRDCLQKYANLISPLELVPQASQEYPWDELQHKDAKNIGCDPEYDVYTLANAIPPTEEFVSGNLRSAGGHVHLGAKIAQDEWGSIFTIRMLDLFLGLPSIFIDHDKTTKARKRLYGKSGRYRVPDHGVEYRSLGNFWLWSPELVGLVYDICEFTLNFVYHGKWKRFWEIDFERLDDDDAWEEENFNPISCHHCHGYDLGLLRKSIDEVSPEIGNTFMHLLKENMPRKLYEQILKFQEPFECEMYKAWDLR